ncbi:MULTISPECIES: helix-turn-helix domain-containing protein [Jeotgalicoccus]|uniref:helix-turn-helix domain-containing protein n=1 Tax=Jeotgalicoccus TaxID=227979 RepID=UPI0004168BC7|nr:MULTISPECIES: XRE family transcriptional regulator [Jeotgalicoccus]QQD84608.1 helix-turn-helix transcriptional regulator [Jeotgalicoccus sp. ATCC 8456]
MKTIPTSIKTLRLERRLTLKELSNKTDLSVSFLSQVERGESSPAITSLNRIAEALDVNITYFFTPLMTEDYKISYKDSVPLSVEYSEQTMYRMSSDFENRALENYLIEIPSGSSNETVRHVGEEMYYLIEGNLTVYVNNKKYELEKNDVIHFPSNIPHHYENNGDKVAKILCVITPTLF